MGIYIDMEMPKEGFVEILIRDDGTVQQTGQSYRIDGTDYYTPYVSEMPTIYNAISVPPHGDLIDRDYLKQTHCAECTLYPNNCLEKSGKECDWGSIAHLNMCPVIIPAEEDE